MSAEPDSTEPKSPLREILQPFVDLIHAPRALWGINLGYVLEGMVYFGVLGYLAIHFSEFIFQGVEHADEWSHNMVMVLTAGITISMFFLGFLADKWGVRRALLLAFVFCLVGRSLISGAPTVLGFDPPRPAVRAGDRVSLRVEQVAERDDNRAIVAATIVSREAIGASAAGNLATELSAGPGTAPTEALESRLVSIAAATVVAGKGQEWTLRYGSQPIEAKLLVHSARAKTLCVGAVVAVDRGYVYQRDRAYIVRSHWWDDFSRVDTTRCESPPRDPPTAADPDEAAILAEPATVPPGRDSGGSRTVSLGELQALDAPRSGTGVWAALFGTDSRAVDGVVRAAVVTYVRNGGYLIQTSRDGPAIAVFLDPRWSPLHLLTMLGILLVVIGYGMYQPAAYAAVRRFTTPKTAGMGFAMLYALMNLGGWLPTFAFLARDREFLGLGITGTFWIYTGATLLALLLTAVILSRRTVETAIARVKEETARIKAEEDDRGKGHGDDGDRESSEPAGEAVAPVRQQVPLHMWILVALCLVAVYFKVDAPTSYYAIASVALAWAAIALLPGRPRRWLVRHPLADVKFFYFIFALIPVQTLFTYNWLVLPQYIKRSFDGWIGGYFEIAANANPILIFILVPIIAALTQKAKVYSMMVYGTIVMAAPAFLLVAGPHPWALFSYILIMTVGEAMWQPRFLQYAAEIAPEGRTGEYMGVAQLPWFLTKVLVPLLYSGWMMDRYCPAEGVRNTEAMWLVFGLIAIVSPVMLLLAKGWIGKDFKTRAE